MKDDIFPELSEDKWKEAIDSASAMGQQGLVRALRLTTLGISGMGVKVGTGVRNLGGEIEKLNLKLTEFNASSSELSTKALSLTKWIMWATIVSSVATLVLGIDVVVRWFGK